jgi:hypothetical protein
VGGAILSISGYRWHGLVERRVVSGFIGPLAVAPFVVDGLSPKTGEAARERIIDACVCATRDLRGEELILYDTVQSQQCLEDRPAVNRYIRTTEWVHQMAYHYVLDLRPEVETLWTNLETRCRTSIRRAREQLTVVRGGDLRDGRERQVALMYAVYRREGMVLVDREHLLQVWDHVYTGEYGQAFFCLGRGEPCAFTGVARLGKVASYQHAGRTEDAPSGAAALGLWAAIEWAKEAGCVWFDCNGAVIEKVGRERQRAISVFKRGFGGGIVQVHGVKRQFRPLARATYDFVDAWGRALKRLLRVVGPQAKGHHHG